MENTILTGANQTSGVLSETELNQTQLNSIPGPEQPEQPQDVDYTDPTADPIEDMAEDEGVNPLQEVASAVGGGAVDAIESAGGFAELTGDTIKTGLCINGTS